MLYSDFMATKAKTYVFREGESLKIYPGVDTPRLNFFKLKELLLSKDLSRNEELNWISKWNYRFLDGQDIDGWHTTFNSFPRSGNTMLRGWTE